jgi:hypothetical protein
VPPRPVAEEATEGAVLDALRTLAAASSTYRERLEACRPYVDRLAEDYGPGGELAVSVMVALAEQMGTPVHVERSVRTILGDLASSDA